MTRIHGVLAAGGLLLSLCSLAAVNEVFAADGDTPGSFVPGVTMPETAQVVNEDGSLGWLLLVRPGFQESDVAIYGGTLVWYWPEAGIANVTSPTKTFKQEAAKNPRIKAVVPDVVMEQQRPVVAIDLPDLPEPNDEINLDDAFKGNSQWWLQAVGAVRPNSASNKPLWQLGSETGGDYKGKGVVVGLGDPAPFVIDYSKTGPAGRAGVSYPGWFPADQTDTCVGNRCVKYGADCTTDSDCDLWKPYVKLHPEFNLYPGLIETVVTDPDGYTYTSYEDPDPTFTNTDGGIVPSNRLDYEIIDGSLVRTNLNNPFGVTRLRTDVLQWHGTGVTGFLGAQYRGEGRMRGLIPKAKIVNLARTNGSGAAGIIDALHKAAMMDIDILSFTWGDHTTNDQAGFAKLWYEAFAAAADANILVFNSAGNGIGDIDQQYQCDGMLRMPDMLNIPNLVVVGGTGPHDYNQTDDMSLWDPQPALDLGIPCATDAECPDYFVCNGMFSNPESPYYDEDRSSEGLCQKGHDKNLDVLVNVNASQVGVVTGSYYGRNVDVVAPMGNVTEERLLAAVFAGQPGVTADTAYTTFPIDIDNYWDMPQPNVLGFDAGFAGLDNAEGFHTNTTLGTSYSSPIAAGVAALAAEAYRSTHDQKMPSWWVLREIVERSADDMVGPVADEMLLPVDVCGAHFESGPWNTDVPNNPYAFEGESGDRFYGWGRVNANKAILMGRDWTPEICNDGIDNDGINGADCADATCADDHSCLERFHCNDGIDNDGINGADCADAACSDAENCNCGDLADNDGDKLVDCADILDCPESPECTEICDSGYDDDYDGFFDCKDVDCANEHFSATDPNTCEDVCRLSNNPGSEWLKQWFCPEGTTDEVYCWDGVDNDGDGLVDCADRADCEGVDPACEYPESTCGDGFDNDGNGLIDCAEEACEGTSYCSVGGESVCWDSADNDNDTFEDCRDYDCSDRSSSWNGLTCADTCLLCVENNWGCESTQCPQNAPSEVNCWDYTDNDGDGFVDYDDESCNCADQIDNDDDGWTDCQDYGCGYQNNADGYYYDIYFLGDTCVDACQAVNDTGITGLFCPRNAPIEVNCWDDTDNDGDGFLDCQDYECRGETFDYSGDTCEQVCEVAAGQWWAVWFCPQDLDYEVNCWDGIDNDSDGNIDGNDPDCDGLCLGDWNVGGGVWRSCNAGDGIDDNPACVHPDYGFPTGPCEQLMGDGYCEGDWVYGGFERRCNTEFAEPNPACVHPEFGFFTGPCLGD